MERVNGSVKLSSNHQQIMVQVAGRLNEWRTGRAGNGGRLLVKVAVDLVKQSWDVKVKGFNLFAPVTLPCSCQAFFLFLIESNFQRIYRCSVLKSSKGLPK